MAFAQAVRVTFTKSKETQNTMVFKEDGKDPKIGTLYLQKTTFSHLGEPGKISVAIEAL